MALAILASILAVAPETQAGVIITDGCTPSSADEKGTTSDSEADDSRGTNLEAYGTDDKAPVSAYSLTDEEQQLYILAAYILNRHVVVIEDPNNPPIAKGEVVAIDDPSDPDPADESDMSMTTPQRWQGVEGGTDQNGCTAVPLSGLGALCGLGLLLRRRRRS